MKAPRIRLSEAIRQLQIGLEHVGDIEVEFKSDIWVSENPRWVVVKNLHLGNPPETFDIPVEMLKELR